MENNSGNAIRKGVILHGKAYRYEIIRVLGQGTFGITYLASVKMEGNLGAIDTYVAIKEFFMSDINGRDNCTVTSSNKDGLFDKYKRKFIKEAQSLGRLGHPNIVKVIEAFEANNTIYYAMDFIDGGSLNEYISQKGTLTEEEAIEIAAQILEALAYMHSKNMLHLDLKPNNIMMHHGRPILIDFGLSKQYDEEGNPESSTMIGGGTLGYAPIEQSNYNGETKAGSDLPVTMDLYALGATMYKMLTGKRPPIAYDVLNQGFPEAELISANVSAPTRELVKSLMKPLWRERPQTDSVVRTMIDNLRKGEFTTLDNDVTAEVVNSNNGNKGSNNKSKKRFWFVCLTLALIAIVSTICMVLFIGGNNVDDDNGLSVDGTTAYIVSEDIVQGEDKTNVVEDTYKPDINYYVVKSDELCDENAKLWASIDGERVEIGSINYVFGNDNMANMSVYAQEDFDGDGIRDALVNDVNVGNMGGSTWAFIKYDGDNTFVKSNLFSEFSYYEVEISTVNGKKVVDFIQEDLGEKIVKERHALVDGEAVSLDLPKSKTQAYTPLYSIKMDDLHNGDYFNFDLNDDGVSEKIVNIHDYHAGRDFLLYLNGNEYEFSIGTNWGSGTLTILKSKTNGMHDILAEGSNSRFIYKWDGLTYLCD